MKAMCSKAAAAFMAAALLTPPIAMTADYREGGIISPGGPPIGHDAVPVRPKVDDRGAPGDRSTTPEPATQRMERRGAMDRERQSTDAAITGKIKAEMARDRELSAMNINVDTDNGVVTLSGDAKSNLAADKAVTISRGVGGVQGVKNNITVIPDR
jgi:hypothetical protein